MSIRCFIAVELDPALQEQLQLLQNRFRRRLGPDAPGITWVDPHRTHLTLKFLGDVKDRDIPEICRAAAGAAAAHQSFDIRIAGPGCFPPSGAARVLWLGLSAGSEPLLNLHRDLDSQLTQIGFPPEHRRFSAHLTLARIRLARTGHAVRELLPAFQDTSLGAQAVTTLTVFQSELTRTGPIYTPLHHADLARSPTP